MNNNEKQIKKNDTTKCSINISDDGKHFETVGEFEVSSNQDVIAFGLLTLSPFSPINIL